MYKLKLGTPLLKLDDYEELTNIFMLFHYSNKEIYLVGGAVRDLLLNLIPNDFDLTTNATPQEIKNILKDKYLVIETSLKHGTLTVIGKNKYYEITTYRIEQEYLDNRHPNKVQFITSLEEDLKRRDFTINSFAYDLLNNEILMLDESYLSDLNNGIVKAIGEPTKRFNEDALRMLRCIRFSSFYNFKIEANTFEALKTESIKIRDISKERIRDELTKIISSDNPKALVQITDGKLEKYLFNGLTPISDILNSGNFIYMVRVMKYSNNDFISRWSIFFGYLNLADLDLQKKIDVEVLKKSPEIMNILKFSNYQKRTILGLIKYFDCNLSNIKKIDVKHMIINLGKDEFPLFLNLKKACYLAREENEEIAQIESTKTLFKTIISNEEPLYLKDLKISGNDIKGLGVSDKKIGETLSYLLDVVLNNPDLNEHSMLLELAKAYLLI